MEMSHPTTASKYSRPIIRLRIALDKTQELFLLVVSALAVSICCADFMDITLNRIGTYLHTCNSKRVSRDL